MAVLEAVAVMLLLGVMVVLEAEERGDPARSARGKKSPAPGPTLKRRGSVLPGDKWEQQAAPLPREQATQVHNRDTTVF